MKLPPPLTGVFVDDDVGGVVLVLFSLLLFLLFFHCGHLHSSAGLRFAGSVHFVNCFYSTCCCLNLFWALCGE